MALNPLTPTARCVSLRVQGGQKEVVVNYIRHLFTRMKQRGDGQGICDQHTLRMGEQNVRHVHPSIWALLMISHRFRWVYCPLL
jgi:hypothetical protein